MQSVALSTVKVEICMTEQLRTLHCIVNKNDKTISIIPAEINNFVYFDLDINCKVGVLAK